MHWRNAGFERILAEDRACLVTIPDRFCPGEEFHAECRSGNSRSLTASAEYCSASRTSSGVRSGSSAMISVTAIRDHGHHGGDRNPQPTDAGLAARPRGPPHSDATGDLLPGPRRCVSPALSDLPVRKITRALEAAVGFVYVRTKGAR